jgi:hypothetical protein
MLAVVVLVVGDVEAEVGNLRLVDLVVMDGFVLDGDALRAAAGFNGRPK